MGLTLRRLTALEETKLTEELKELETKINRSRMLLASPAEVNSIIIEESLALKSKYGMPRKSTILSDIDTNLDEKDLIPNDRLVYIYIYIYTTSSFV